MKNWLFGSSTRIKDAGIAIRHSRGYTFLYCRVQKQIWGNGTGGYTHIKTEHHIKKTRFSYGIMFWGRQTGWKTRAGSAGSDNSAHWSCKRWVTAKVFQNWPIWLQNHKHEGFKNLDSGIPKFSRRRPTQPSRPVGFQQETTPQTSNNSKKCGF